MKTILLMFIIVIPLGAQTVYEVQPGTKGNEVVLSIVNESTLDKIDKVSVVLKNSPNGIEINNKRVEISNLQSGEEREAVFSFEVKRNPPVVKDTLKFVITDNLGGSWTKEIYLQYSLPKEFKLEQNYPNPFNPTTKIDYQLPKDGRVTIKVFNILGQEVMTLVDEIKSAGYYSVEFNATGFSSGVYFYCIFTENYKSIKKMVLLK